MSTISLNSRFVFISDRLHTTLIILRHKRWMTLSAIFCCSAGCNSACIHRVFSVSMFGFEKWWSAQYTAYIGGISGHFGGNMRYSAILAYSCSIISATYRITNRSQYSLTSAIKLAICTTLLLCTTQLHRCQWKCHNSIVGCSHLSTDPSKRNQIDTNKCKTNKRTRNKSNQLRRHI